MALNALPTYEGAAQQWLDLYPESDGQVLIDIVQTATPLPLTLKNAGNTRKLLETELANALLDVKPVEQALNDAAEAIKAETAG
jgi:hypothetical protein